MMSIVHRITGAALLPEHAPGGWVLAAASGPNAYAKVQWFMGNFVGRLILFRLHLGADPSHVRRRAPLHWDTGWLQPD